MFFIEIDRPNGIRPRTDQNGFSCEGRQMPEQMSADPFVPFEGPHIGVTYQGNITFILDPHYPNKGIVLQVAPEFNPTVNLPLQFFNRHIGFTPSVRRYDAFVS